MEEEDIKKKIEEDFDWLVEIFPQIPEVTFLEPIVQSLAIFNAANGINISNDDVMIVAVAGFVATRARVIDEDRFMNVFPTTYLQFAFLICNGFIFKRELTDDDFKEFLARININKV